MPTSAEDEIRAILEDGIAAHLFPGAVAVVSRGQSEPVQVTAGAHTYDTDAPAVSSQTLFDMASLTKVLATTTAVLQLAERNRLSLSDPVGKYVTAFAAGDKGRVTVSHLLTHTGGLKADLELAKLGGHWNSVSPSDLWDAIEQGPLTATPGQQSVYSDLGFLLLGRIAEIISGTTLDTYAQAHIFGPLGMTQTRFCPPPEQWPNTAPTEYDTAWRGKLMQGQVHDEKAFLLGGVAGHAGLFATASDLHRFVRALLDSLAGTGEFVLDAPMARAMIQNQTPHLPVGHGWGWALEQTFLGEMRPRAFGHTGFTGVSLAASTAHSTACILLTNCVYPLRPDTSARQRIGEIRARLAGIALRLPAAT